MVKRLADLKADEKHDVLVCNGTAFESGSAAAKLRFVTTICDHSLMMTFPAVSCSLTWKPDKALHFRYSSDSE